MLPRWNGLSLPLFGLPGLLLHPCPGLIGGRLVEISPAAIHIRSLHLFFYPDRSLRSFLRRDLRCRHDQRVSSLLSPPEFFRSPDIGHPLHIETRNLLLGTRVDFGEFGPAIKNHRVILHLGVMDIRHVHRLIDDCDVLFRLNHAAHISRLPNILDRNEGVGAWPNLVVAVHRLGES